MGIWNSTLVYVGARTLLAGAMIALLLRRRVGPWYAGGQVVSDLSCAAFLLGYVNADIRDDIGLLVVPLLLFVLYWETLRFLENRQAAALREDQETWLDIALRLYGLVWSWGFVLPAVLAGGFLIFNLLAPNQWPFPNPRPPIACSPKQLQPGEQLTVRMQVPHGAELSVFTPQGRALVVVPYVAKTAQAGQGFAWTERVALVTDTIVGRATPAALPERVFTDSGVYVLSISSEAELSASLVCRVRYRA
ncbi:MAG TPA: hypothetical protein VE714_09500 [Gemmatimonadales bacterium]|nr:hypothetical protein [Gemmatimonadales bacterium]